MEKVKRLKIECKQNEEHHNIQPNYSLIKVCHVDLPFCSIAVICSPKSCFSTQLISGFL